MFSNIPNNCSPLSGVAASCAPLGGILGSPMAFPIQQQQQQQQQIILQLLQQAPWLANILATNPMALQTLLAGCNFPASIGGVGATSGIPSGISGIHNLSLLRNLALAGSAWPQQQLMQQQLAGVCGTGAAPFAACHPGMGLASGNIASPLASSNIVSPLASSNIMGGIGGIGNVASSRLIAALLGDPSAAVTSGLGGVGFGGVAPWALGGVGSNVAPWALGGGVSNVMGGGGANVLANPLLAARSCGMF